jgi:hypothetical protein
VNRKFPGREYRRVIAALSLMLGSVVVDAMCGTFVAAQTSKANVALFIPADSSP